MEEQDVVYTEVECTQCFSPFYKRTEESYICQNCQDKLSEEVAMDYMNS